MTSDAKIGLLLGLVFIFIIAFLINGLPGLHGKDDTNKLTTNMVDLQSSSPGIGANERKVQLTFEQPKESAVSYEAQAEPVPESPETRFTMALPQDSPPASVDSTAQTQAFADALPAQSLPAVQSDIVKSGVVKSVVPKFYVVQEGDTLSSIAKKCYGEQEGNKLGNVNALFEANRITLVSADELHVGQKLVIPPLTAADAPTSKPGSMLSEKVFSKIESIGKRHLPASIIKSSPPKQGNIYIVKEGDSLWRIASEQLGDGNRYKEIVRLNKDIIASEDDIQVDMKLKLPAR